MTGDDDSRGHRVARPHQQEAIAAGLAHLAHADRAQVVMACGTGKTLVGQRVAESLAAGDGLTLLLCPTISLTIRVSRMAHAAGQARHLRDLRLRSTCQ